MKKTCYETDYTNYHQNNTNDFNNLTLLFRTMANHTRNVFPNEIT